MKRCVAALFLVATVSAGAFAAKGPEVALVDDKLSVNVEAISVGRLLQLIDLATGMKSKVPPELSNRNISAQFTGLNVADGVRKIFQGYPLDYVIIQGKGIVVTAASQSSGPDSMPPAFSSQPAYQQPVEQPFVQEFPPNPNMPIQMQQQLQGQQPAMVQTPFGLLPNPRAQQQQPNVPLNVPGQQNSLFPQPGQTTNQPQVLTPFGTVPGNNGNGMPTPFGTPTTPTPFNTNAPFGTANPPVGNQNNGLFGQPTVIGAPGTQPR